MNYQVADLVIRLKNASAARRRKVIVPSSNICRSIADLLKRKGFLDEVKEESLEGKKALSVVVHYEQRKPVVTGVEVISKPSLRVYSGVDAHKKYRRGLGLTVLSTNQGIMTIVEAKKKGIGGEVLFRIW